MAETFLTAKEAAERLNVSYGLVVSLIRQGKLRAYKVGSLWRIDAEDLQEYIEQSKYKPYVPKYQHRRIVTRIS